MGLRDRLEEKIQKKEQEIRELEIKIREARASIDAWQELKRMIPKDANDSQQTNLRPDSLVGKTHAALEKAGKPLHVGEILKQIGEQNTSQKRLTLSGSLGAYVRRNRIFTRTGPNTFGLKTMGEAPEKKNGELSFIDLVDVPNKS